jgi:hypothetical protein
MRAKFPDDIPPELVPLGHDNGGADEWLVCFPVVFFGRNSEYFCPGILWIRVVPVSF